MNKTPRKKTKTLASVGRRAGGLFVFATLDDKMLTKENVSKQIAKSKFLDHKCETCHAEFAAPEVAGMQYHCVSCGSTQVKASVESKDIKIPQDSELIAAACSECGTHEVLAKATTEGVPVMACVCCGSRLGLSQEKADVFDMDDSFDGDDSLDDGFGDDPVDDDFPDMSDSMDTDIDLDDLDDIGDGLDEMDIVDIEEDAAAEHADGSTTDPTDPKAPESSTPPEDLPTDPITPADVPTGEKSPGEAPPAINEDIPAPADTMTPNPAENPSPDEPVTINVLQEHDSESDSTLAFVYIDRKMAIANADTMQILASLSPEDAGVHADKMHSQAFQTAVVHSIKTLGLHKTVANYGFKPVTLKVNVARAHREAVQASVDAAKAQVARSVDALAKDFQQSVDIAAAGYASNFWRDRKDPVKAALIEELKSLGIKPAQRIVDGVFASHGVQQMRDVLERARELSQLDVEGRNGLATAMSLTQYLPMVTAADESDDESDEEDMMEDQTEDATFASLGRPIETASKRQSAKETASPYRTAELRQILGSKTSLFS